MQNLCQALNSKIFSISFIYFFSARSISGNSVSLRKKRTETTVSVLSNPLSERTYFRVTLAPCSSSLAFSSSASALDTPSLITFGALSTRSLASFRPSPVTSRTTLITLTLESPALVSSTSKESFSSAAAASPAPAAATTTPAAADTPNSSSQALPARSALIRITL